MNHESASYKRYKEELSNKTYIDYVMSDGEISKLLSINNVNTLDYGTFINANKDKMLYEISDIDSVIDVVKYIEFEQASKILYDYDINSGLRDLAIRHMKVSMKVNTNVSDDDIKKVSTILKDLGLLIETLDILDYAQRLLPISYSVRFMTLKILCNSLTKAGISHDTIQDIKRKEYEDCVTIDMIRLFRELNLKVSQFYGSKFFVFKSFMFMYEYVDIADLTYVYKFIDSFEYMLVNKPKYVLYLYNGCDVEDKSYNGTAVAVRNITGCMDKFLINGQSFTKSFKSRMGD